MRPAHAEQGLLPKKILVAVDESGLADPAIAMAGDLAGRLSCELEYFHAVRPPMFGWQRGEGRVAAEQQGLLDRARAGIAAHVERALARAGLHRRPGDAVVTGIGSPGHAVADRVRETGADWVVLGALRRAGSTFDFGGTARAVLARIQGGVWAQTSAPHRIERLLVPVDLGPHSLHALATARALAPLLRARIHVLCCFESLPVVTSFPETGVAWDTGEASDVVRAEFERAMQAFDWRGAAHEHEYVEGAPAKEILARLRAGDLVVMGTHGRGRAASALLGSVAYAVLKHATGPVLALRLPETGRAP